MRIATFLKTCFVLGAFLGCDSEVTPADGGGGSGTGGTPSQGGSPIVSGGGGAGGSGGAPTTNAGGSGGAAPENACEQVCQNVEECFNVGCGQAGVDCEDPQFDCPAECLKDAPCSELAAYAQGGALQPETEACLADCDTGEGGGGGGSPQACGQCMVQGGCLQPCMNEPLCQGWGQCAFSCSTPDCYADCNAQFPEAEPFFSQIYSCGCDSCPGCEATMDPCNQTGGAP